MMPEAPVIEVSELSKSFKVLKQKTGFLGSLRTLFSTDYELIKAVDDISFQVGRGELVGYLGPNGAGKSTTIKMLTGVLHPTAGEVMVDGLIPYRQRSQNSRKIGIIFGQRSQLIWDLPPVDTFDLLRKMYSVPKAQYQANLEEFIDLLDLKTLIGRPVRQLSLGQRMRCEIVAALLHNPQIVYLDEPTIGLDVVAKERIREFIRTINQARKTTILLTTHDLSDIEKLCKRVIIIDQGRVVYDGSLTALKQRYGQLRRIVFYTSDVGGLNGLQQELKQLDDNIEIEVDADQRVLVDFNPQIVSALELTRYIVNNYAVTDVSVEETDIEVIIRDIYNRGNTHNDG